MMPTYASRFLIEHAHYADDIAFWLRAARRSGGPVLDLGAAAGRVTVPLAAAGHDVTAVDVDPDMLDALRAAAARLGQRHFGEIADSVGQLRQNGYHRDPDTGRELMHWAAYEDFDPVTQTASLLIVIDDVNDAGQITRYQRRFEVHVFLPSELNHLLARAGLEPVAVYGDFDGSPVDSRSVRQIYRCRTAKRGRAR
ncbi:MAG: class I SAM-dependent methyltransferase [Actinobacteria bacterium]|nr:class I SAM-dependent methyltransferase [Actinomycetota bacterium]